MCFSDPPAPVAPVAPPDPKPLYINDGNSPNGGGEGQADFGASRKKLRIELNPAAGAQGTGVNAQGV